MKYKKGDTITIKTHEEMIADPDIKCWFDGDQRKPSGTRIYSCEDERGTLMMTNANAKKVLGKTTKVLRVEVTGYVLDANIGSQIRDWMLQNEV